MADGGRPLQWAPGSRWEYHPSSAHWVCVEIIEAVTACDYRDHLRSAVLDPAGADGLFIGVPVEAQAGSSVGGGVRACACAMADH